MIPTMKTILSIYPAVWLQVNNRKQLSDVDSWYVTFANQLVDVLQMSELFNGKTKSDINHAAITLALYLHDAIAQTGGWKEFTARHKMLYGKPLPFYDTLEDEYIADEINLPDVAFVLWTCLALPAIDRRNNYTLHDPYDPALLTIAEKVYALMDSIFNEAPVDDATPSPNWMRGTVALGIPARPLPAQPDCPKDIADVNARRCLEHSAGYPLLYFADYPQLRRFFVDVLKWPDSGSLLPTLAGEREFVIYANARGMLLAPGVAAYFHDPHNPFYDPVRAATEGYRLFCQPGYCPFDLLKFGIHRGLLTDAQLPFTHGQEILQAYADFLMRYYLGPYYEAD